MYKPQWDGTSAVQRETLIESKGSIGHSFDTGLGHQCLEGSDGAGVLAGADGDRKGSDHSRKGQRRGGNKLDVFEAAKAKAAAKHSDTYGLGSS